MRSLPDRILFIILQVLTQLKRAGLWIWVGVQKIFGWLRANYQETIGFWLYKKKFTSLRKLKLAPFHSSSTLFDFLSRRSVLQATVFFSLLILLIPHSVLYTQKDNVVIGRKTALYALVGSNEEFQEIEDVSIDVTTLAQRDTRSYREGAIVQDSQKITSQNGEDTTSDPTSISAGGQALTKPTIISGTDSLPGEPSVGTVPNPARREIIKYVVQPGDVIGNIATRYNISVVTILWANDLNANSYIRPGDVLTILPVDGVLHTVKSGDVVSRIARTYDASVSDIIAYNRLQEDGRDITVGETLLVPDGQKPQVRYVAAAPSSPSAARAVAAPPPSITAPAGTAYLWPTSVRTITQYYGWRHTGVDIAGPIGTPLYATKAGTVIKSQCGWNGGYGCYIILDHGSGVDSLYGHINGDQGLLVSVGEEVDQGQTIALMGTTGQSFTLKFV